MHFNGSNEEFVEWFNESVKIFHELTANIGNDKRRELTLDPGKMSILKFTFIVHCLTLHFTHLFQKILSLIVF